MKIIGLTGGVGSGKTRILNLLKRDYGAEVILADETAHELMEPGKEGFLAVTKALGKRILGPDGAIDCQALARLIFSEKGMRKTVDGIIHPMVWRVIEEKISAFQGRLLVVESAIMDQENDDSYDEMWYVYTSEENRMKRLEKGRGYTRERSRQIMDSQPSEEEYRNRADRVIDNNGSIEDVKAQLGAILENRGQE